MYDKIILQKLGGIIVETYIKGTFKRNIFSSNDGFTVGLIKIKDTDDQDLIEYKGKQFTFTGLFADLNIYQVIYFLKWVKKLL